MRGIGEQVENTTLIQKILRSLPMRFDSKVSTLEERKDLDNLSMDELHGILTSYEMRKEHEKLSRKEVAFKDTKKTKGNNLEEKPYSSYSDNSDDEEEANFIRKLKRGTGKFKGKLPFNCFKCGRICHFDSKFHYGKGSNNDEEEDEPPKNKNYQKRHKGNWLKKKNLYSREDGSSSNEDESGSDSGKVLFMAFEEEV
jgi:hypothetical protein